MGTEYLLWVLTLVEIVVIVVVVIELIRNWQLKKTNEELSGTNKQLNKTIEQLHQTIEQQLAHNEKFIEKVNELEREDLLIQLARTASAAKESIMHLTYTFHTPDEEKEMGPLLEAVKKASEVLGPDKICFLGPPHQSKVDRLYCRRDAGASVRVTKYANLLDTRFQVVDGKNIVITVGDPSSASRLGYYIESTSLGNILKNYFESLWDQAMDYDDFVKELIREAIAGFSYAKDTDFLSKKLRLPPEEVERIFKLLDGDSEQENQKSTSAKEITSA